MFQDVCATRTVYFYLLGPSIQTYQAIQRQCLLSNKRLYATTTSSKCYSEQTAKTTAPAETLDPDDQFLLQSMTVDENNMWENLESEIGDLTTFNLLKQHYEQRVQVCFRISDILM